MTRLPAVVRFELVRRLRWRPIVWLAVAHPLVVALAYALPARPGPPLGTDVAFMGMQAVWLLLVSFELGRDRELGMDALMTANLVAPREYVLAKLLALGCLLVVYHTALLLVVVGLAPEPGVEASDAAGAAAPLFLLVPLALLTELFVSTRAPLTYVVVVGTAATLVAFWSGVDATTIASWLGVEDGPVLPVRPTIVGVAGLIVLLPLAARRAAAFPPF